jgi:2-phosphoglycerate kinase
MRRKTGVMVAKREGGVEPFELAKPRRCLAAAMATCHCDVRLADALARAVSLHLREWRAASLPSSDYVFRCLCTVLAETGMEDVAQQLMLHRRHRAEQRRRVSVFDAESSQYALVPWRKATVAASLAGRYGLSPVVARILAGEIERRVLALEYSVVSRSLIRELARNELLAWGLADVMTDLAPGAYGVALVTDRPTPKEC